MFDKTNEKVLLIYPFLEEASWKNELRLRENLALGYLSAVLRKGGFSVVTINSELEELNNERLITRVLSSQECYPLIGISCTAQRAYLSSKSLIQRLREVYPEAYITIGGIFPSLAHLEVLEDIPEVDSVVRGEGEYTLLELAQKIWRGNPLDDVKGISFRKDECIRVNPGRERIMNLDELPFPSRDELSKILSDGQAGEYSARLITSKGCYGHCTFCSIRSFYGTALRTVRSPQNVAEEIEQLINSYGIKRFRFEDDIFCDRSHRSKDWVQLFHNEISRRKLRVEFSIMARASDVDYDMFRLLKESGLTDICLGIEAGSQKILDRYGKETTVNDNNRALSVLEALGGINIHLGYIMFDPDLTFEELNENYSWLRDCPYTQKINLYNKLNVYYGTPIAEILLKEGRLFRSHFSDRWNYTFKDFRVQKVCEIIESYKSELSDLTQKMNSTIIMLRKEINRPSYRNQENSAHQDLRTIETEELDIWIYIFDEVISICCDVLPDISKLEDLHTKVSIKVNQLTEILGELSRSIISRTQKK